MQTSLLRVLCPNPTMNTAEEWISATSNATIKRRGDDQRGTPPDKVQNFSGPHGKRPRSVVPLWFMLSCGESQLSNMWFRRELQRSQCFCGFESAEQLFVILFGLVHLIVARRCFCGVGHFAMDGVLGPIWTPAFVCHG